MHRLWDGDMLAHAERDEDRWMAELIAMDTPEARATGDVRHGRAVGDREPAGGRVAYKDPATGRKIKPGTKLGEPYQVANLPVARRRVYQGGVRLAMVLNEVFADESGR